MYIYIILFALYILCMNLSMKKWKINSNQIKSNQINFAALCVHVQKQSKSNQIFTKRRKEVIGQRCFAEDEWRDKGVVAALQHKLVYFVVMAIINVHTCVRLQLLQVTNIQVFPILYTNEPRLMQHWHNNDKYNQWRNHPCNRPLRYNVLTFYAYIPFKQMLFLTTWKLAQIAGGLPDIATSNVCKLDSKHWCSFYEKQVNGIARHYRCSEKKCASILIHYRSGLFKTVICHRRMGIESI